MSTERYRSHDRAASRLIASSRCPRAPRLVSSFPAFDGVYDDDLVAQDRVFASYQASY